MPKLVQGRLCGILRLIAPRHRGARRRHMEGALIRSLPRGTQGPWVCLATNRSAPPATMDDEGLAGAAAASPFVYPGFTQELVRQPPSALRRGRG